MVNEIEKTARTFDEYGKSYTETVNEAIAFTGLSVDFFTRVKAAYLVELAQAHFGGTAHLEVLDVGCGIGNFHPLLSSTFRSLRGVDISAASVDAARANNPGVAYDVYDGLTLPYADATYDAVFTICVLHHVPPVQWPIFVSEMKRILKPGGLALIFEHNPYNPVTLRIVNRCPFDEDAVLLKPDTTRALFHDAGFANISSRSILTVPAANKMLRKLDQVFGRLPIGAQYYLTAIRR
ncbi:methyltransferase domain-containing protein [Phyllobacterium sp. SYP-B3895]|uniref:class I SAM-dependent methyltransferase n=1 Tax=Phyllobacterium sp. SYP-B3895 TaxID=2663240 RepID=UPI00129995CB|nr:class I SAM-dependent methyltransferase [Phyllobacterium sp. SYP-B3895]MRG53973.1 methyltransferase domain-containing protein [Phyllobacterium sp. SYP-B3895]